MHKSCTDPKQADLTPIPTCNRCLRALSNGSSFDNTTTRWSNLPQRCVLALPKRRRFCADSRATACSIRRIPRSWSLAKSSAPFFSAITSAQRNSGARFRRGRVLVENWNSATNFIHFGRLGEFATNNVADQELVSLTAINGRQKRHILADKQEHSRSIAAVLKQHNLAESAKIGHNLAESTKFDNGFDWPLMHSKPFAAEKTFSQEQDLSTKTRFKKQPERDILAEAANLRRE